MRSACCTPIAVTRPSPLVAIRWTWDELLGLVACARVDEVLVVWRVPPAGAC